MSEITEATVTILDLSRAGSGVAKLESGEVVFVPFTAPGDVARVRIVSRQKNYCQGELLEVITASALRTQPPCPVFGNCGGCLLQHLPYSIQFESKTKGVLHALKRAGISTETVPLDLFPAPNPYHYRNRIQLRGSIEKRSLGFFARGSQNLVPIQSCAIADQRINDSLPELLKTGLQQFQQDFKLEASVTEDGQVQSAWNSRHSALGFRQVNDHQNAVLQDWVSKHIAPAHTLLDLYGGAANLSQKLANRYTAVHVVDTTIPRDSSEYPKNLRFHRSEVGKWMKFKFSSQVSAEQTISVILDPPREGLGTEFSDIATALESFSVESVSLVSCDIDSFVRDSHRWIRRGFSLVRLGVLDLFPQTPHVESLALFTKRPLN